MDRQEDRVRIERLYRADERAEVAGIRRDGFDEQDLAAALLDLSLGRICGVEAPIVLEIGDHDRLRPQLVEHEVRVVHREHVLTRVLAELIGAEARKIRMRGRRADLRDLGLGEDRCSSQRGGGGEAADGQHRSEEHTSELQSLMRISYAVFCLKKKK